MLHMIGSRSAADGERRVTSLRRTRSTAPSIIASVEVATRQVHSFGIASRLDPRQGVITEINQHDNASLGGDASQGQ